MSDGTPVGGGFMRQRHNQEHSSSGDDLEDDACSGMLPPLPPIRRARTWAEAVENVLWIGSAAFIIYFGDGHSNFINLLWLDDRIKRMPLYLGMASILLNVGIFFYMSLFTWGFKKSDEKLEVLNPFAAPIVTLPGLFSFCSLSIALWPIWNVLTLLLLFTLFMACIVISPYLTIGDSIHKPICLIQKAFLQVKVEIQ